MSNKINRFKIRRKRTFDLIKNGDVHNIKGHGLGLAYVKKIVSLHNGKISVESIEGQGTKFKIQFPLFI